MTPPSPRASRALAVTNAVVVFGVVAWNGWVSANGLGGRTVGGVSAEHETLFTPAGYAFSIWGLIYLGLLVNAGYQLWTAFGSAGRAERGEVAEHRATLPSRLAPWLILTNLANAIWLVLWLTDQIGASVVALAAMFAFLSVAMVRLDMERWDAPFEVIAMVWWPLAVYAGWVTVAVLANLSVFVTARGWVPGDSEPWALAMIGIATTVNLVLVVRRNLREHAAVAIWALVAIAVAQWEQVASVQWAALGCAALLAVVVSVHAYRNRHTLPGVRRGLD